MKARWKNLQYRWLDSPEVRGGEKGIFLAYIQEKEATASLSSPTGGRNTFVAWRPDRKDLGFSL